MGYRSRRCACRPRSTARRLGGSGALAHQTEAGADLQVVHASIAIYGACGPPRRAGWREAEQRLPWAIEVKNALLSSLDTRGLTRARLTKFNDRAGRPR